LHEDESSTPSGPAAREAGPQEPVGAPKLDSPSRELALEDEELMAKSEHLGVECSPTPEQRPEGGQNGQEDRDHPRIRLAQIPEILNHYGPDQVLGRHRREV
jgi:hypothetical protein